jgi:hypothetical protein
VPAKILLATLALLLAAAAPASAAIVINEVESSGIYDYIELTNTGGAEEDIGGYILKDSNDARTFAIAPGTKLAPGGFYAARVDVGPGNFGLGDIDSARVFTPGGTLLDSYSWTTESPTTNGRCPNGTGAMTQTERPTPDAANRCFTPVAAWPGGVSIATGDVNGAFTNNMSGLAYQPSGSATRGTLWAVRNSSGAIDATLYKLAHNGTNWVKAEGWGVGKQLFYSTGFGSPDAEGVTLAGGDPNAVYVATERDGGGGSLPKVLRFDVSSMNPTLAATDEWDLTLTLPALGANLGLEAIAWVPDDVLVAKGFFDEATNAKYSPASYPGHGSGLFFVGVEQDGSIVAYALPSGGAPIKVATIDSGFPSVMDLEYQPETKLLWAACDDTCLGRTATFDVAGSGKFAATSVYERPGEMPNLNNEGFAIAPQAECVNNLKPAFWLDDTNALGNALRVGTIPCTVPTVDPGPSPTPVATASPQPTPVPVIDRTAPKVRVSLTKPAKKGTYAVRKTGKLKLTITLDERSDLTIKVSARKTKKAKLRTLTTSTRRGVAAGKPSYTLTLSSKVRKALKAGETLTIAVQARDAAGNVGTASATGKVR